MLIEDKIKGKNLYEFEEFCKTFKLRNGQIINLHIVDFFEKPLKEYKVLFIYLKSGAKLEIQYKYSKNAYKDYKDYEFLLKKAYKWDKSIKEALYDID